MSDDLASTIQCKVIITPLNSAHHVRTVETIHIQNQRAHFAVGDSGVLPPDQVDQLGGNKNRYYAICNKKHVSTNMKSKKKAVEDIVKKLFKLQSGNSVKFRLYNKTANKSNKVNKTNSESYMAYRSRQSKRFKYRVQPMY